MKIKNVSIYNFRSLQKVENINIWSGFDIFIGKNDAWKSSFLKALDNFLKFKENFSFIKDGTEKTDLSTRAKLEKTLFDSELEIQEDEIGIVVTFEFLPIDRQSTTIPAFQINLWNELTILKKGNATGYEYFIFSEVVEWEKLEWIFSKTNTDLKKLFDQTPWANEVLINENETGKPTNSEYIQAILTVAKLNGSPVKFGFTSVDIKKGDLIFPKFELIESHGTIDWSNKIIDWVFKIVGEKLANSHKQTAEYQNFLGSLKTKYNELTENITAYAKSHYLRDLIKLEANPQVQFSIGKELLIEREGQGHSSHFDNQWDGTKRRLMVAMLQCSKTLERIANNNFDSEEEVKTIWAFDEPELHLHPWAQRDLFESLKTFSENWVQVLCSTHSTIFVDRLRLSSSHLFDLDLDGKTFEKRIKSEDDILNILWSRNSDLFFASKIILVEWQTEESAMPIFYKEIIWRSLSDDGVQIVCAKWCEKLIEIMKILFQNFNNVYALLDTDTKQKIDWSFDPFKERIHFIGTKADFEDAFDTDVWQCMLNTHFDIDWGGIWTSSIIGDLFSKITITEKNKKLLKLVQSKYNTEWQDRKEGATNFEKEFNKPDIWVLLANTAIAQNKIPTEINTFIEAVTW